MRLVLISGLSGSGKSIALKMLEDRATIASTTCRRCCCSSWSAARPAGLRQGRRGCRHPRRRFDRDAAAAARFAAGAGSRTEVPLPRREERDPHQALFRNRRTHPLARDGRSLSEAIVEERDRLEGLPASATTSTPATSAAATLREWVRQFIEAEPGQGLVLMFQSFGFKHGLPLDADFVFDVRCLPNPHYDPVLRPLTGLDEEVVTFLENQPDVHRMRGTSAASSPAGCRPSSATAAAISPVAVGCTGGQHRSVCITEWLAREFAGRACVPSATANSRERLGLPAASRRLGRGRPLPPSASPPRFRSSGRAASPRRRSSAATVPSLPNSIWRASARSRWPVPSAPRSSSSNPAGRALPPTRAAPVLRAPGWLKRPGEIAICAPNHVSLQIAGGRSRYDSVSY